MNKKIVVSAFVAAFLATSASAFDLDHNHQNERRDGNGNNGHHKQRDDDHGNSYAHSNDHAEHATYRGAGPRHDLHEGARLPSEYRNNRYVVNNWRRHRLSAPPRGYHWVQTGGDYVLAAAATGLIAQVFLNN